MHIRSSQNTQACTALTLLATWMLVLELGQVVDILIHNDVEIIGLLMFRNVSCRETFRHVVINVTGKVKRVQEREGAGIEAQVIRQRRVCGAL